MTEIRPELPLYIDSTMVSCFRSCPRKFFLEFILGLRPARISVDLHAGACFATALETYYVEVYVNGKGHNEALALAHGAFMISWGDFEPMTDTPKTKDRVWQAVEDYFAKWPPHTDPVQPFILEGKPSAEFTFAIPLEPEQNFPMHPSGGPFLYSGRLDLLGKYGPRIVGRDEKTTKSIGSDWASQWDLRSQFIGYTWALQQSGLDCDTIIVRGIGILKTKITLVEVEKTYSDFMRERWLEQLRRDLWRLRRMWDEGYFDYNLADACSSYGGCAFRDVCASKQPENWYSNYVVRRWNPLLKNPTAELAA